MSPQPWASPWQVTVRSAVLSNGTVYWFCIEYIDIFHNLTKNNKIHSKLKFKFAVRIHRSIESADFPPLMQSLALCVCVLEPAGRVHAVDICHSLSPERKRRGNALCPNTHLYWEFFFSPRVIIRIFTKHKFAAFIPRWGSRHAVAWCVTTIAVWIRPTVAFLKAGLDGWCWPEWRILQSVMCLFFVFFLCSFSGFWNSWWFSP